MQRVALAVELVAARRLFGLRAHRASSVTLTLKPPHPCAQAQALPCAVGIGTSCALALAARQVDSSGRPSH